jgi:putative phosphoesterase
VAGSLRIAVIADTHDRLVSSLLDAMRDADEIWHLGDVCEKGTLKTIQDLGPRVFVVRGNQDNQSEWPISLELERFGHRFHLVHIPPRHAPVGTKFLLHGHTHVPRDQKVEGTRFLNPGPAGLANKGAPRSFAWLELAEGREPVFRLAAVR